MTSMTEEQRLMRTDTRGRVRVPQERREALLDEFDQSGMSGAKFAQLAGVKYQTFAVWVQKRRRAKAEAGGGCQPAKFAEAVLDLNASSISIAGVGLAIELPGGARMVVQSPVQLQMAAELLRMISAEGKSRC